jgi:S-methylmethionine-dependent homocysteine/selenocysteine methylase
VEIATGISDDYVYRMTISKPYTKARERLKAGQVLILDGGVSTELERRGIPMSDELWSGRVALDREEAIIDVHRTYIDASADLLLLEMMSIPARMTAMFDALRDIQLPVWCGLSAVRDVQNTIRSWHETTTAFSEIVELAAQQGFDALGIMHTSAELIDDALPVIRNRYQGPMMAYPDSGYLEMPHWRFVDTITPQRFAEFAHEWRRAGAQIIGGCCGLGPEHIGAIADMKSR